MDEPESISPGVVWHPEVAIRRLYVAETGEGGVGLTFATDTPGEGRIEITFGLSPHAARYVAGKMNEVADLLEGH